MHPGAFLYLNPALRLSLVSHLPERSPRGAGASLSRRLLVGLSPALVIGGAVDVLMALVVTVASIGGHRVNLI
jgi:hypothetical protein